MPTVIAVAFVAGGLYYVSLVVWPYTSCKPCSGGGRNAGSNRRWFGSCGRCGGSGRKLRLGVRMFRKRWIEGR